MSENLEFIKWIDKISKDDAIFLGTKAAQLGELYLNDFPIPKGFVITQKAFVRFLVFNKLDLKIKHILSTANFNHLKSLHQISDIVKKLILDANFPTDLISEISLAYLQLHEPLVAIRFSQNLEQSAKTRFVETPEAILNVKGDAVLFEKIKKIWTYAFDSKEIFYRHTQGQEQIKTDLSLIISEMIEADCSGFMYTSKKINNNLIAQIHAIYGLGELLNENKVKPDIYDIDKKELKIIHKSISNQSEMLVKADVLNKIVKIKKENSNKQKVSDNKLIELTKIGNDIDKLYFFPQKVEWVIKENKIYLISITQFHETENNLNTDLISTDLFIKGFAANKGIASGHVKIVLTNEDVKNVNPEDIVILKEIKSTFLPVFKNASAVVVENADRNIQILFGANELRLPCVTNATNASNIFKPNEVITVNGTKGEVYKGGFSINPNKYKTQLSPTQTVTKVFVGINKHLHINSLTVSLADGITLLNSNVLIKNVGIHPKKLIKDNKKHLLINEITQNLTNACKILNPRPVMYQISNLTSLEYRYLEGGSQFEQIEENPSTGFRGSFRHIHDEDSFKLELEAIKNTLIEMHYQNLWIIIPFVRTTEELIKIKEIINKSGLQRSSNLKLLISLDIPSNIIMLEKFIEVGIDGIFINSSLLSSLLTGTDKQNIELTFETNKYNTYLKWTLERIIKTASELFTPTYLYDEAYTGIESILSDLVTWGLTGISVSPDLVDQTKKILLTAEKKFINNHNG